MIGSVNINFSLHFILYDKNESFSQESWILLFKMVNLFVNKLFHTFNLDVLKFDCGIWLIDVLCKEKAHTVIWHLCTIVDFVE